MVALTTAGNCPATKANQNCSRGFAQAGTGLAELHDTPPMFLPMGKGYTVVVARRSYSQPGKKRKKIEHAV